MAEDIPYVGQELDLFAQASRWKKYWSDMLRPYLGAEVLEVGAGLGVNTPLLYGPAQSRWVCLEPDPNLSANLSENLKRMDSTRAYESRCGTLSPTDPNETFDTIIYIDVLEHIEDDAAELLAAAQQLLPGGRADRLIACTPVAVYTLRRSDRPLQTI